MAAESSPLCVGLKGSREILPTILHSIPLNKKQILFVFKIAPRDWL